MAEKQVYLTPEGLKELEEELHFLRTVRRKEIADQIYSAKELGTTVNNAEYDDAKREQSFVEGRVRELETLLMNAKVVPHEATPSLTVKLGSTVKVASSAGEEETFTIVGSAETHPLAGRISNESPVGKALIGRRKGEQVQVMAPGGVVSYTIVGIQ